jgi:hypothetical protein
MRLRCCTIGCDFSAPVLGFSIQNATDLKYSTMSSTLRGESPHSCLLHECLLVLLHVSLHSCTSNLHTGCNYVNMIKLELLIVSVMNVTDDVWLVELV